MRKRSKAARMAEHNAVAARFPGKQRQDPLGQSSKQGDGAWTRPEKREARVKLVMRHY